MDEAREVTDFLAGEVFTALWSDGGKVGSSARAAKQVSLCGVGYDAGSSFSFPVAGITDDPISCAISADPNFCGPVTNDPTTCT